MNYKEIIKKLKYFLEFLHLHTQPVNHCDACLSPTLHAFPLHSFAEYTCKTITMVNLWLNLDLHQCSTPTPGQPTVIAENTQPCSQPQSKSRSHGSPHVSLAQSLLHSSRPPLHPCPAILHQPPLHPSSSLLMIDHPRGASPCAGGFAGLSFLAL